MICSVKGLNIFVKLIDIFAILSFSWPSAAWLTPDKSLPMVQLPSVKLRKTIISIRRVLSQLSRLQTDFLKTLTQDVVLLALKTAFFDFSKHSLEEIRHQKPTLANSDTASTSFCDATSFGNETNYLESVEGC